MRGRSAGSRGRQSGLEDEPAIHGAMCRSLSMEPESAATSLKQTIVARMAEISTMQQYQEARRLLQEKLGGVMALRDELTYAGFIEPETGFLTLYEKPTNAFAFLAAGSMSQPGMLEEQEHLGSFKDKYMICGNRPENDAHWDSTDPRWIQKASMAKRHRFLTTKNLHWQWFNALVFGLVPKDDGGVSTAEALAEVEQIKAACMHYATHADGWSSNIGLFVNVFGHNNVNSLFIHILDLSEKGPSFSANSYKNLPLDAIITALKEEVAKPKKIAASDRRPRLKRRTTTRNGKDEPFFFAGTNGATSLKEELTARMPVLKDAASYRGVRNLLLEELGGITTLKDELINAGFLNADTGMLTTDKTPFNVFAQIAAGNLIQPGMEKEQAYLGEYKEDFIVCCNLPANDEHWDSEAPEWVGKSSMAKRHRFLTVKDLHWRWFNALVFGLVPSVEGGDLIAELAATVAKLRALKEAALLYTQNSGGWSDKIGLYFHVFGHNSANSLHLHIVDMSCLGPSFRKHEHKNCPLDAVLSILTQEMNAKLHLKRLMEASDASAKAAMALQRAASIDDGLEAEIISRERLSARTSRDYQLGAAGGVGSLTLRGEADYMQAAWEAELVTLNVSGELVVVPRSTLLLAPSTSLLHETFRLPSKTQQVDSAGNIFLNYPPESFKLIIDRLRLLEITQPDVCLPVRPLPKDVRTDTIFLSRYLGMEEGFFDKPQWGKADKKSSKAQTSGPSGTKLRRTFAFLCCPCRRV